MRSDAMVAQLSEYHAMQTTLLRVDADAIPLNPT
jgi:hypothetical protein